MKNIVTHLSVDLDAVASVWAYRRFRNPKAKVRFIPANPKAEDVGENEVALDLSYGLKGMRDEDGNVISCFASLVANECTEEERTALNPLVKFVDAQVAHGNAIEHFTGERCIPLEATSLNAVLWAFKSICFRDDEWVVDQMAIIFNGILASGLARQRAENCWFSDHRPQR